MPPKKKATKRAPANGGFLPLLGLLPGLLSMLTGSQGSGLVGGRRCGGNVGGAMGGRRKRK